jgi:hypothetical protein
LEWQSLSTNKPTLGGAAGASRVIFSDAICAEQKYALLEGEFNGY